MATKQTFDRTLCRHTLDVAVQVSWISKQHGGKRIFKNKCKPCQSNEKNACLKKQRITKSKYWQRKLHRDAKYYAQHRQTILLSNQIRYHLKKAA
jgi:hypothetical protein